MSEVTETIKPGIYESTSFVEYLGIDATSASILRALYASTPAHVVAADIAPTKAMASGTVFHCMALEPDKFDDRYYIRPILNIRKKDGSEYVDPYSSVPGMAELAKVAAMNEGKICLDPKDYENCAAMTRSVQANALSSLLLANSRKEIVLVWQEHFGMCKARLDMLGDGWIADLKSTTSGNPSTFCWTVSKSKRDGYGNLWVQAAWYARGARACGLQIDRFDFVAVESRKPWAVSLHTLESAEMDGEQETLTRLAENWAQCVESKDFPGYPLLRNMISLGDNADA